MQRGPVAGTPAVHVQPRRCAGHHCKLRHRAYARRQRRVLEGRHARHPRVRAVRAGAALALVALDGRLQVGGVGEVVELALHGIQIFCVSRKNIYNNNDKLYLFTKFYVIMCIFLYPKILPQDKKNTFFGQDIYTHGYK